MADTHSALEQLADISEPAFANSFALAPLWWLLLVLLSACVVYILLRAYQRWRFFAAKRQALQQLARLSQQPDAAIQINLLLKRVLQHYQPGHPALSYGTVQWQHWLASQCTAALPDLTGLLYRQHQDSAASEQLYQFARTWLQHYRGRAAITTESAEVANA